MAVVQGEHSAPSAKQQRLVVAAASLGTVFEWYDFFVYGTLAGLLGTLFFPAGNETAAFLLSLATFGAGFFVRPFGALFFGALGDIVGRKYTFLVTIVIMGVATAGIGFLPTYHDIGIAAAVLLLILRLAQGLAIGGEYGGAATYVAEHAPHGKRGYFTSYIQATATIGLFLSLAVVAACRGAMSEADFAAWGWRIPFLISLLLLAVSVYIRMKLSESPVFKAMKEEGKGSKRPIRDSFGNKSNLIVVLIAFFGCCIGQSSLWYTANFYAMLFMQNTLGVGYLDTYIIVCAALAVGMVLVVLAGALSDVIGRKWLMVGACLIAGFTFQPIFHGLAAAVNPALMRANETNTVTLIADPATCGTIILGSPTSACQKVRAVLSRAGVQFKSEDAATGAPTLLNVPYDGEIHALALTDGFPKEEQDLVKASLKSAGYPATADSGQINWFMAIFWVTCLTTLAAMIYGPIAAFLVELFPTRIRYTSLSLPYNISNGVIGGFQPFVSFAIITATGDIFAGLWYPIGIALVAFIVGSIFLPETKDRSLDEDKGR